MNVERYLFQSPYSSSVQVGRPDPSVKSENGGAKLPQSETLQNAKSFANTQTSEVKPKVESSQLLDIYA